MLRAGLILAAISILTLQQVAADPDVVRTRTDFFFEKEDLPMLLALDYDSEDAVEPIENDEETYLCPQALLNSEYPASRHHAVERIYGPYEIPLANGLVRFLGPGVYLALQDGSIWHLNDSQASIASDWLATDPIVIKPHHPWFSTQYPYKFVNLVTQNEVEVSLEVAPFAEGSFVRWIHAINYGLMEIYLQDGSHWYVSSLDSDTLQQWKPDHHIIIGTNNDWLSFRKPNILINTSLSRPSYVRAVSY